MKKGNRMAQTYPLAPSSSLRRTERLLLLLPLAASTFVGLLQLVFPTLLASWVGYSGNDLYIYRLSGAATFGYAGALALALKEGKWPATRLVLLAFFTFGLASLYACGVEIFNGLAQPVVYVVLALTLVFVAITGTLLYTHRSLSKGSPDIAPWLVWFVGLAILPAVFFGLLPLLLPQVFSLLFLLKGTDVFIFRQAGAATLGYAVMGLFELRSRTWQHIRWSVAMAGIFNGLSLLASLLTLATGGPMVLALLVTPVTIGVISAVIVAFRRQGR
jgi:hypothetical protein